jgi:hypothetical protein
MSWLERPTGAGRTHFAETSPLLTAQREKRKTQSGTPLHFGPAIGRASSAVPMAGLVGSIATCSSGVPEVVREVFTLEV